MEEESNSSGDLETESRHAKMQSIFKNKESIFIRKVKQKNKLMLDDKIEFHIESIYDAGQKGWNPFSHEEIKMIDNMGQKIIDIKQDLSNKKNNQKACKEISTISTLEKKIVSILRVEKSSMSVRAFEPIQHGRQLQCRKFPSNLTANSQQRKLLRNKVVSN
jgi:hypothetical protein